MLSTPERLIDPSPSSPDEETTRDQNMQQEADGQTPVVLENTPASLPPRRHRVRWILLALVLLVCAAGALWATQRPTGMRHYLVLGRDGWGSRENANAEGRTDAMMLLSLDFDRSRLILTSFLRDTQVTMPGGGQNKLNTIAHFYDDATLADHIAQTYHIAISGTFSANFTSMVGILDAMGGVTVHLTKAEVNYLRKDAGDYPGFYLHEGECLLNGAQGLSYMRCRALDNDMGRTERQANVVRAVMGQADSLGLMEIVNIVRSLYGSFATDVSLPELVQLARDAYTLRRADLVRHQIPAQGTYRYGELRGGSVLVMNEEKNVALFTELLADQ